MNAYFNNFWNRTFSGNAYEFKDNNMPIGWTVKPYYYGMIPKVGDVIVGIGGEYTFDSEYGHVAVVKSANKDTLETYDQNFEQHPYVEVFGNHTYSGVTHIISPVFSNGSSTGSTNENINNTTSSNPKVTNVQESSAESGTHVFDKYSYIRTQPLANAPVIAYYNKGDKVFYDKKLTNDGYRWLSYISYGGNRRYVAIQKLMQDNVTKLEQPKAQVKPVEKPIAKKSTQVIIKQDSGTYYFTDTKPVKPTYDIGSDTLAEYHSGMSVQHDQKVIANGYEWLSYIGYSGNRRYIPIKVSQGLGSGHRVEDQELKPVAPEETKVSSKEEATSEGNKTPSEEAANK